MQMQKLRLQHGWFPKPLTEWSESSVRTSQRVKQRNAASVETWNSQVPIFNIEQIRAII
jgi:hypothetical protein